MMHAPRATRWPKAVLFDLDGTLIDSAPDIRTATNLLLAEDGLEPLTLPDIRSMIGNGVRKLVERAFAARGITLDESALDQKNARMMEIYAQHLTIDTALLQSAAEVLKSLHENGVKTGVVTNKPEGFSRQIIAHFALDPFVDVVVGGDTGPTRKPAPDMLYHAVEQVNLRASDALLVGDSPADIGAAQAAGMRSIAVRGGYTNVPVEELGAGLVIDTLDDLSDAIAELVRMEA